MIFDAERFVMETAAFTKRLASLTDITTDLSLDTTTFYGSTWLHVARMLQRQGISVISRESDDHISGSIWYPEYQEISLASDIDEINKIAHSYHQIGRLATMDTRNLREGDFIDHREVIDPRASDEVRADAWFEYLVFDEIPVRHNLVNPHYQNLQMAVEELQRHRQHGSLSRARSTNKPHLVLVQ
jgi:hypothetical protein